MALNGGVNFSIPIILKNIQMPNTILETSIEIEFDLKASAEQRISFGKLWKKLLSGSDGRFQVASLAIDVVKWATYPPRAPRQSLTLTLYWTIMPRFSRCAGSTTLRITFTAVIITYYDRLMRTLRESSCKLCVTAACTTRREGRTQREMGNFISRKQTEASDTFIRILLLFTILLIQTFKAVIAYIYIYIFLIELFILRLCSERNKSWTTSNSFMQFYCRHNAVAMPCFYEHKQKGDGISVWTFASGVSHPKSPFS